MDLRSWCEFDLRKRILAVAGIAQVSVIGGELPEYRVQVDSDVLHCTASPCSDVADAADNAHSAFERGVPGRRGSPGIAGAAKWAHPVRGGHRRHPRAD
ncbi:MAG: hypothetical protein R3E96_16810 [Planctomycetota bacterium]